MDIWQLVLGQSSPQKDLIEKGVFPESWMSRFKVSVANLAFATQRKWCWPKKAFQALHYCSMHLPLRYDIWRNGTPRTDLETELSLTEVQFATEEYLWSAVADLPSWRVVSADDMSNTLNENDAELVELCFGEQSPVHLLSQGESFHSWKEDYVRCLMQSGATWVGEEEWPKWLCMAIHFASFYVDLYQTQELSLGAPVVESRYEAEVATLVDRLRLYIDNQNVLLLIGLWLAKCGTRRSASGLPRIAQTRPATGQFISVRTISEFFIQEAITSVKS